MDISLNYGKSQLSVSLPDELDVSVIRKPEMPLLDDPVAALESAFANPAGGAALGELAAAATSACILICDITRPVPNHVFLAPLLKALMAAGLNAGDITILVATGLHRPNEGAELAELVGDPWVMENFAVANHFARDDAAHISLGRTRSGTEVGLDRRFVEADLRIATGLVEPHFMAGWSGGRKVIAPGIAHADTITAFHSARFMEHPGCDNCVLDGNPLHEEQLEIVAMLGGATALNVVIDEARRISMINFGEVVESHMAAVAHMRAYAEIPVAERFPTVVTSAAGYPLDKTYYQTVKGMVGALDILQPGGSLVIASACSEGMGSAEYVASQRRLIEIGGERFLEGIKAKSHAAVDEWQTEMLLKPLRAGRVGLYTDGLSEADFALTGVEPVASVAEAVAEAAAAAGDRRIAVIPEGPYVVPRYRPAS
ncbi:MAG: nickel-dependent lactate racemase [Alphaproteobacteria bacterium]|jgi:nickel-dependent lactate racemase|nr:nickel-dependent lactate racemase [Alphaproteobacteria bacterium]MDP6589867.1 nickel-dependent lactate racemase [Alphaproteobacteria bacterium]MDP6819351.1 nickel-dependent lactate racemase [Alphaproteobacteria bacterium]